MIRHCAELYGQRAGFVPSSRCPGPQDPATLPRIAAPVGMHHVNAQGKDTVTADRALVNAFVQRHFSLRGSLRMHRASLGLDLLRAPLNVALAPVFLLVRLSALVLIGLRLRRAGRWLATRRILLRSELSRRIEHALKAEVLGPRSPNSACTVITTRLVADYVGVRSAVAEILTTSLVILLGWVLFRAATPGVLSLAPLVSGHAAYATAIAEFPLGRGLGRMWYGAFPVELSPWYVTAVAVALVLAASLVTTFAGIFADPVQARLGLHRRRLLRLLARIDRAEEDGTGIAQEHILARVADLADAATALLRMLRP